MSRFAIGVAPVACGLSSGLVLDHARNAVSVSRLTCFDLGSGCSIGSCLTFGGLSANALLLLKLHPFALGTPFFPGRGYGHTPCLPYEPGRFCGFLCGTMCLKKSSFCVGSGTATFGEVVTPGVSQI